MKTVSQFIIVSGLALAALPALAELPPPAEESPAAAPAEGATATPDKADATKPAAAEAATSAAAPAAPPAPPVNELAALSTDFWGDWKETKESESFVALKAAVGSADKNAQAIAATTANTQVIVNLAVDKAEDAAVLMSKSAEVSNDATSAAAVSTVLTMVTSPKTREAAVAYVEPQAQARVEQWNADLSSGIQGLPGIYLGDEPRAAAPPSYAPVASGSYGCPTR